MAKNPIFSDARSIHYIVLSRVKNEKKWHFSAIVLRTQRETEPGNTHFQAFFSLIPIRQNRSSVMNLPLSVYPGPLDQVSIGIYSLLLINVVIASKNFIKIDITPCFCSIIFSSHFILYIPLTLGRKKFRGPGFHCRKGSILTR